MQGPGKILTINPTKPARFIPLARNTFVIKNMIKNAWKQKSLPLK